MSSQSTQPRIPPELIAEIAAHNADDVAALRAMSLVSKAVRTFAIEYLFAVIHFACKQDITWWDAMVQRTPRLQHIVKRVKFSDPSADGIKCHQQVQSPEPLSKAVVPPKIPIMPNVSIVEWESDTYELDDSMAIAYMSLFPNSTELCLSGMIFFSDGLASGLDQFSMLLYGRKFRVLSFCNTYVWGEPNKERLTLDLPALEELRIVDCPELVDNIEFGSQLVEASRPTALKSLTFAGRFRHRLGASNMPCSLQAMENVFFITSPCLVNLSLIWNFYVWDIAELAGMLNRLPEFPALDTLSLFLNEWTERLLNALPAAPRLTTLHLRVVFDGDDDYYSREDFRGIIYRVFPWGGQSMRGALTQKFPLLQRTEFQFCAPRHSVMHFRRGFRRRMERELVDRLQDTGADLAEYFDVRWLDSEFSPVVYSGTNGKPRWKLPPDCLEPETEESDCESDPDY